VPRTSSRQKAEAESALLASIVSSSDDAIASKTLDGIVTSWNQGAERLFGFSAEQIIGRSITLIIPHDRLSEEKEILARVMRGERVDHFETVRRCTAAWTTSPDGLARPGSDGRIIGASKIARDITERSGSWRSSAGSPRT
jgi:PAS domain S-box-containing protein